MAANCSLNDKCVGGGISSCFMMVGEWGCSWSFQTCGQHPFFLPFQGTLWLILCTKPPFTWNKHNSLFFRLDIDKQRSRKKQVRVFSSNPSSNLVWDPHDQGSLAALNKAQDEGSDAESNPGSSNSRTGMCPHSRKLHSEEYHAEQGIEKLWSHPNYAPEYWGSSITLRSPSFLFRKWTQSGTNRQKI